VNDVVTAASIAILIALCFGLKFLRSLVLTLGVVIFNGFFLLLLFNGSLNNVLAGIACCLFISFLWIYVHAKEEREQKEQEEQYNNQSNLA
jgi:Ca2+/Na+ antiporter